MHVLDDKVAGLDTALEAVGLTSRPPRWRRNLLACTGLAFSQPSFTATAHSNPAWRNPVTAKKLGVKTGDLVRIETGVGHMVTKAYVTEGIHPKVISIPTAFGHWEYGRLATLKLKLSMLSPS